MGEEVKPDEKKPEDGKPEEGKPEEKKPDPEPEAPAWAKSLLSKVETIGTQVQTLQGRVDEWLKEDPDDTPSKSTENSSPEQKQNGSDSSDDKTPGTEVKVPGSQKPETPAAAPEKKTGLLSFLW